MSDDVTEKRDGSERCVHQLLDVERTETTVKFRCTKGCGYAPTRESVVPRAPQLLGETATG